MKNLLKIFFCIQVFNCNYLLAQPLSSPFIVKRYTGYDGLPHNYILNLRQDDRGYLWVGTASGLCRFDGENFSPVNIKDRNKNITATFGYEMTNGNIWIWSNNGSEYLFDGKKINPVPNSFHNSSSQPGFEGTLYWGDGMKYFVKLETKNGTYFNYHNEIVFVGKTGDSLKIDQSLVTSNFMHVMGFADNQLYFYTNRGIYSWSNNKIRPLFQKQILGKPIYTCYRDSKKRFWIGTRKEGVYVSKPGEENVIDYHIQLTNNLIAGFYEDNEGNMWIAGYEGLLKVQDVQYEIFSKNDYPFLWDISLVSESKNHEVFLFNETYGLIRRTGDKFIYSKNNCFKGNLVDAHCYDKAGRLWGVSRQNRLLMYDGKKYFDLTNKTIPYNSDLSGDIVYDEYRNKIWITRDSLSLGDENGFVAFKTSNKRVIKKPTRLISLPGGKLLVATETNELLLIDSSDHVKTLNTPGLIVPKNIQNFYKDTTGNLFISFFEAGLVQCRLMKNDSLVIINSFNTRNVLKNNFVTSLSFDKQNRLWVSTLGGISVINYTKKNTSGTQLVYHFGLNDGLPEFPAFGHLACDENGNIWYTTLYSVSKFHVNEMRFINKPPPVSIENVTINMKETDWTRYSDSLSGKFQLPVNPVLKRFENTITISFRAASMINSGGYEYSYMLYGLTNNWSGNSSNNTVTITKLNPGTYTFLVRAKRNNSDWSSPASFTFTISRAWWQQWWFSLFIILAGAGIIYWINRIRTKQLNKEKNIRDQIASDLHDDLGSTLNSVKVFANVAFLEKDNKQYLEKINESTREAIISLRDIIWVLDEKKDSLEHLFTRINHFANPVCDANHIKFIQHIDNSLYNHQLHREEKRNLFMILKEVINNSIKYAACKTISVTVVVEKKKLQISISDDGTGFDVQRVLKGNGMNNIRKRAHEIHYHIEIKSKAGTGTNVMLGKI